jgi:hypothetical protein
MASVTIRDDQLSHRLIRLTYRRNGFVTKIILRMLFSIKTNQFIYRSANLQVQTT